VGGVAGWSLGTMVKKKNVRPPAVQKKIPFKKRKSARQGWVEKREEQALGAS